MLFLTGFTYDPVGNRLSSIDNSPWSYNTDNELMGFGATQMTYDANGNMTADSSAGSSLSYDFENRLASFVTSSVTANYLYDPQGRRLQKTVNSVVTRYLWDGATMIAELDGTNQITRLYTYNPQSMEPVSTAIGCTAYFYITDHLMTPQMLTSTSGTTVWYAELSAFGTANVITSTVTNNLRFPGQYADGESGLYYNYARYYMPQAGRYAETDPILQPRINEQLNIGSIFNEYLSIFAFNPQKLQEYLYAMNNPLHWIDLLGLGFLGGTQISNPPSPNPSKCAKTCNGTAITTLTGGGCDCFWICSNILGEHKTHGIAMGGEATPDEPTCLCNDPNGNSHHLKLPPRPIPEG